LPGNASKHVFNLFQGLDFGGQEMHQNMFLPTPDVEKYLCEGLDSVGQETHQNTFLNTPDVEKYLF
jgi:hypothetical protein